VCAKLHREFFVNFPDDAFCDKVGCALTLLVERHKDFSGAVGAWAGGIVHAVRLTNRIAA